MECSTITNSIGLILDIVGALLLLRYGLPAKVDPEGHQFLITEQVDEEQIKLGKIYKKWSTVAIVLIIIGFGLQLVSNFI